MTMSKQTDDIGYKDMMGPIDDAIYTILDQNKHRIAEEKDRSKDQPKICWYCHKPIIGGIEGIDYLDWTNIQPGQEGKVSSNHIKCGRASLIK